MIREIKDIKKTLVSFSGILDHLSPGHHNLVGTLGIEFELLLQTMSMSLYNIL